MTSLPRISYENFLGNPVPSFELLQKNWSTLFIIKDEETAFTLQRWHNEDEPIEDPLPDMKLKWWEKWMVAYPWAYFGLLLFTFIILPSLTLGFFIGKGIS